MHSKEFPWAQYKPEAVSSCTTCMDYRREINLQCNYTLRSLERSDSFCRLCTVSYLHRNMRAKSLHLNWCRWRVGMPDLLSRNSFGRIGLLAYVGQLLRSSNVHDGVQRQRLRVSFSKCLLSTLLLNQIGIIVCNRFWVSKPGDLGERQCAVWRSVPTHITFEWNLIQKPRTRKPVLDSSTSLNSVHVRCWLGLIEGLLKTEIRRLNSITKGVHKIVGIYRVCFWGRNRTVLVIFVWFNESHWWRVLVEIGQEAAQDKWHNRSRRSGWACCCRGLLKLKWWKGLWRKS